MGESYDPACQDLAEHFLQNEPYNSGVPDSIATHEADVRSLAIAVQQAVESWFMDHAGTPSA